MVANGTEWRPSLNYCNSLLLLGLMVTLSYSDGEFLEKRESGVGLGCFFKIYADYTDFNLRPTLTYKGYAEVAGVYYKKYQGVQIQESSSTGYGGDLNLYVWKENESFPLTVSVRAGFLRVAPIFPIDNYDFYYNNGVSSFYKIEEHENTITAGINFSHVITVSGAYSIAPKIGYSIEAVKYSGRISDSNSGPATSYWKKHENFQSLECSIGFRKKLSPFVSFLWFAEVDLGDRGDRSGHSEEGFGPTSGGFGFSLLVNR